MATVVDWQGIGLQKRASVQALIPDRWKLKEPVPSPQLLKDATAYPRRSLQSREIMITEKFTAMELIKALASGALSAVEVTEAFCHRAAIAHQIVNCLSEIFFEAAFKQAADLDDYFKSHGKPVGPLHGLPISLKDQMRVQGVETSLGYVAYLGQRETADSESFLVKKLRDQGAVFYVKTNVPTSLMAIETNNNIIGYTWNAFNRILSSGGSSGGEAAIRSNCCLY